MSRSAGGLNSLCIWTDWASKEWRVTQNLPHLGGAGSRTASASPWHHLIRPTWQCKFSLDSLMLYLVLVYARESKNQHRRLRLVTQWLGNAVPGSQRQQFAISSTWHLPLLDVALFLPSCLHIQVPFSFLWLTTDICLVREDLWKHQILQYCQNHSG